MPRCLPLLVCSAILPAVASQSPPVDRILERLDRLERENDSLRKELQQLKTEVAAWRRPADTSTTAVAAEGTPTERLDVVERRVDEQAQTKVEAAQKFPIKVSGMLLANLYRNTRFANGADNATTASRTPGRATAGLSFRQSVVGLEYTGGQTVWGGRVRGSAFVDFYEGNTENTLYAPVRLRTASLETEWANRSVMVGMEKPLFSQRDPTSFSFVGVSPLTSSGNLWRWQPQIRFEQRVHLGAPTTLRLQGAVLQTNEESSTADTRIAVERRRPSLEGRFELEHKFGESRAFAIAPGFHWSDSHVLGRTVPSRLFSIDWKANPLPYLDLSGIFWSGENVQHFGALRQGLTLFADGRLIGVHSKGGWAQASIPIAPKVSVNLFSGIHDDRNRDLLPAAIGANRSGGANLMYRLAPNVILSLEALQTRTDYLNSGQRKNNRYDLSVVYLF
ncbi:MAG: hypothetical protein IT168_09255 [Bryobacterales bacterium]|nr:hypothetical protein [Bryobacterales bacterium]